MESCSGGDVLTGYGDKFSTHQCLVTHFEIKAMKDKSYASLVGIGMYAQFCTKSDLAFALNVQGRFQSIPVCYSNADFGGCVDERISTSGYMFILADGAVSWRSKKQTTRSVSTMKSKYIGCFKVAKQCVWLKNLIHSMKIFKSIDRPLKLYCDNRSAMFFAKNNKRFDASRLMDIKYWVLQDKVIDRVIDIEHHGTLHMIADPLTKAFHATTLERLEMWE
ncbi:hypothetical protein L3X38_041798 [Prunus dulcis]|uniref:Transposable element protein n=1 Tax=Prunus dulcis TaxID=3755 RepID=A0AAD4YKQ2_PRUDU|nr:hypothetical protein L3X38_041798 [Prunus dulcis]